LSDTVFGPRSLQETGQFGQIFEWKRWSEIWECPLPSYRHILRKTTKEFAVTVDRVCRGSRIGSRGQCTKTYGQLKFNRQYSQQSKRMWSSTAITMVCNKQENTALKSALAEEPQYQEILAASVKPARVRSVSRGGRLGGSS